MRSLSTLKANNMSKKVKIKCKHCGEVFTSYYSNKRKFCTYECSRKYRIGRTPWNKAVPMHTHVKEKISKANIGRIGGMKGKEHTKESKEKIRISMSGEKNPNYGIKLLGKDNPFYGKEHSKESIKKISKAKKGKLLGEKNPSWKGGTVLLGIKIRNMPEGIKWRKDVFERDNYTCKKCKKIGGSLEAHHIKKFSTIIKKNKIKNILQARLCEELWDINNGKTLCKICHRPLRKEQLIFNK